jgi:hypothetical protein
MLSIFLALLGFVVPLQEPDSGCARVNAAEPPHALSFERIGEGPPFLKSESRHRVWLRFRNNTTCAVFVELGQVRRVDGTYATELVDGEERRLSYYLADSTGRLLFHVSDTHEQVVTRIKPGYSVVFDVPQAHFKAKRTVILPVAYVWEGLEGLSTEPGSRRVAFSPSALSDNVRQQLKR